MSEVITSIRKTMLIRSLPTNDGYCRSCGAAITWMETELGRRMPMDRGFTVAERLPGFLRVYCDQSHFSNCPDAKKHRKGGR